jgi:ribose transport system substrate-binding protein
MDQAVHRFRAIRPRTLGTATGVALLIGLTACGGSSTASSSGGTAKASAKGHVNLAFELVLTGVKFAQDAALGIRAAATDAGNVSVSVSGPPSVDPVAAQQQVTDELSQSPDGYAIDPYTPDLWQRTLATVAKQVKNTLVMSDRPVVAPGQLGSSSVKTYVGISDAAFATTLATDTIKNARLSPSTTGKVLLGQCVPGKTGTLAERSTAFLAVIHRLLPKTTVIQFDSQVVPTANTSAWTAELQANPNPVLALGGCDQDGASLDIVKKKLHMHFVAAGVDLTPQSLSGVADGTLTDTLNEDYYVQGYVVASLLAQAARGHALPQGFVDTGFTLITKSNVAAIQKAESSNAATIAYWKPAVEAILKNVHAGTFPLTDAWKSSLSSPSA